MAHYVFFDVANTLLHKPKLWSAWMGVLSDHGCNVDLGTLKRTHIRISEATQFPPKTSKDFYHMFNAKVLTELGVRATKEILIALFERCTYLPWERFDDSVVVHELGEVGIISNWDLSLSEKLALFYPERPFSIMVGSAECGFSKPDKRIYELAMAKVPKGIKDVYFIGDSPRLDIVPSSAVGMKAILIDREDVYKNFDGPRVNSLLQLKDLLNG